MTTLNFVLEQFAQANIQLSIHKKHVKHINFRLKGDTLYVSAPYFVSQAQLAQAILSRLDWAKSHRTSTLTPTFKPTTLWGKPYDFANTDEQLAIYRHALQTTIPDLQAKWQPIVGAVAQEVRIKKMISRFGTCNHPQKRIWLSLYLPKFDYECTEYVFVHELCHLHHPNHSQAFWQSVQNAMPDYQQWHQFLKGQSLSD